MNILDIANQHSREQVEADPNVALMIVHPEERLDATAMIQARSGVKVVHREPGLGGDTVLYIRCDDEWEKEGLERAWMSFRRSRRTLSPRHGK
ncbi:hypothetical protein JKG68_23030 [Microvirga aerilata]|uniref:Uncharacterized protein n=1 Tax=Microvirga aerilata TaxID=670292 RepID=A0A936ZBD8_9HYPH|nr:hypothetical protein [Microvirga aerilata]MBL0406822.1 hypothetical protein [Microvirga aerilata]